MITSQGTGAPYSAEAFCPLPGRCFCLVASMAKVDRRTALSRSWGATRVADSGAGMGAVSCWVDAAAIGYHRRWMLIGA